MRKIKLHISQKLISICLGVVYLWFGSLKFFPGLSPAEDLAKDTINVLTFSLIPSEISIILLAIWETTIGIFFLLIKPYRWLLYLALTHLVLTFSPLLFFPHDSFTGNFGLSLIGQYIIKNLVLIAAIINLFHPRKKYLFH